MSLPLLCPKCEFAMEQPTGETILTHCPACGQRLTCPRCGSTLHPSAGDTARLTCTACHLDLSEIETLPLETTSAAASALPAELPGFELRGEVGRGGMGIVYRAHQLSLRRDVAVKVLPPVMAANRAALERFQNEAAVAARLVDAHILPVFDVREVHGLPVIVMPLIEGSDLGRIIRDRAAARRSKMPDASHPWATLDDRAYLDRLLPILDQSIAAVTALHRGGVLHRDIKPSNVLVDEKGSVWLSDFGLARLEEEGAGTLLGQGLGTAAYSSPEQARGQGDLDFRADVFSLGVTLYQALTLELPFGKYGAEATQVKPPPPSARQKLLNKDFDATILKCIERDRHKRYASVAELEDDWRRVRQGLLPRASEAGTLQRVRRAARRHPWRILTGAAIILLAAALALAALPRDTREYRDVYLQTDPPGAKLALVPLDPRTGFPAPASALRPAQATPVPVKHVPPGPYLVIAVLDDKRFHEVYRTVPRRQQLHDGSYPHQTWDEQADGVVNLEPIRIPKADVTTGMVHFAGGEFMMGGKVAGAPPFAWQVAPFYLDPTEVTVAAWRKLGRPLPPQLQGNSAPDDFPITLVTFDDAVAYAEKVGKRLPEEDEYEFAATNGGKTRFPWGNDDKIHEWSFGKAGEPAFDRTQTDPPVFGLFSNVAEWTSSWNNLYPSADPVIRKKFDAPEMYANFYGTRVVRGGPFEVLLGNTNVKPGRGKAPLDPRFRHSISRNMPYAGLGFRCARSVQPRFSESR